MVASAGGLAAAATAFRRSSALLVQPMQTIDADVVVAGAGAVGLAVARALCLGIAPTEKGPSESDGRLLPPRRRRRRDVLVLDARPRHGAGVSSRSSEVVHAGLYYLPGSLKARTCVEGSRRLYELCAAKGVRASKIGKLVVAPLPSSSSSSSLSSSSSSSSSSSPPASSLEALLENARTCGVRGDLRLLSAREARKLEPALWRRRRRRRRTTTTTTTTTTKEENRTLFRGSISSSDDDGGDDDSFAAAGAGALLSPESGIFDSHAFLDALAADVESSAPPFSSSSSRGSVAGGGGGVVMPRAALVGGDVSRASSGFGGGERKLELLVRTSSSSSSSSPLVQREEIVRVRANALVCAAGIGTCRLLHGDDDEREGDDGGNDDASPSSPPPSSSLSSSTFVPGLWGWPRPEALPPRSAFAYAKGNYFALRGGGGGGARGARGGGGFSSSSSSPSPSRSPFSRLIYPLPDPSLAGLGIHATLDLEGRTRFGPDVEWLPEREVSEINGGGGGGGRAGAGRKRGLLADDAVASVAGPEPGDVDSSRAESFYSSIRSSYWPELPEGSLMPDYAGVRPKLLLSTSTSTSSMTATTQSSKSFSDFYVAGPVVHGARGVVVVAGIESPGLTASLALADEIVRALDEEG